MKRRFLNLLNYSYNCIKRYRVRTAVILVCLAVTAGLFSSISFIKDGLTREGELSLKYAPDLTVQGISVGRQAVIETRYAGIIQTIPGVQTVLERIWGYGNIGNTLIVIIGVDLENSVFDPAVSYPVESGSFLDPKNNATVVIGKAVADLIGAKVGTMLTILSESNQAHQYEIVGIFNSESGIYNSDMILMSKTDARVFFDFTEDRATDLLVYTKNVAPVYYSSQVNFVAREISELPNVRVLTKDVLLKSQEATYGARSGFFSVLWVIVLISVALIAFNQTVVVGHESKFEVGLLKALGFSTSDVIQVRLFESTILGVIAGSIGLAGGIIFDIVLNAPIFRDFMLGWAVLYPNFAVPTYISAQTILLTYIITTVPLLFATVIPSWINATVDPDIAMRGAAA
jgi:ABC-type lipoprotein release transport system permease subunit